MEDCKQLKDMVLGGLLVWQLQFSDSVLALYLICNEQGSVADIWNSENVKFTFRT